MITRDEWDALAAEPMTRERYEALCAQYGSATIAPAGLVSQARPAGAGDILP